MNNLFANYCDKMLDLKNAVLTDGYYYASLPLCIIDSIYSINANYTSTVNVVKRFCKYRNIPIYRKRTTEYPDVGTQFKITEFVKTLEENDASYNAKNVFSNLQRTSSRSGILKAEAVYLWAKALERHSIDVFQDVNKIDFYVENELFAIKGQGSGLSLSYFYMLSGNDERCKPDRHILKFISDALDRSINDTAYAQKIMTDAVSILKDKYPHINVRLLDNMIWKFMSK